MRYIFISIIFFSIILETQGQIKYTREWSVTEDANIFFVNDCPDYQTRVLDCTEIKKIRLDVADNIIIGSSTFIDGQYDIIIIKYDQDRNKLWDRTISYGTAESEEKITHLEIINGDEILISGYKSINQTLHSILIKLDANGEVIWEREYSFQNDWTFVKHLYVDLNGDIYLTGQLHFGPELTSIFVTKFDKDGQFIWEKSYGENDEGTKAGFQVKVFDTTLMVLGFKNIQLGFPEFDSRTVILRYNKDGELLLAKENPHDRGTWSSTHIDEYGNCYIGLNPFYKMVKYNANGEEEWNFEQPSERDGTRIKDILTDDDGNVYLAGHNRAFSTNGNLQVIKLSSAGEVSYKYIYKGVGTDAFDGANTMSLGPEKLLAVGGQSQRDTAGMDYDFLILVLDSTGSAHDTIRYNKSGDEMVQSIHMDDSLRIFVTGAGTKKILTQKYIIDIKSSTAELYRDPQINIFPNPSNKLFNINANHGEKIEALQITDQLGKVLINKNFRQAKSNYQVSMVQFPKGLYLISCKVKNKWFVEKLFYIEM